IASELDASELDASAPSKASIDDPSELGLPVSSVVASLVASVPREPSLFDGASSLTEAPSGDLPMPASPSGAPPPSVEPAAPAEAFPPEPRPLAPEAPPPPAGLAPAAPP